MSAQYFCVNCGQYHAPGCPDLRPTYPGGGRLDATEADKLRRQVAELKGRLEAMRLTEEIHTRHLAEQSRRIAALEALNASPQLAANPPGEKR